VKNPKNCCILVTQPVRVIGDSNLKNFQLELPTRIHFGTGVLESLGEETARFGSKALIVYGQGSIKRNGIYNTVMDQLSAAGIETIEHAGVKPNPVLSHAEEGVTKAVKAGVDVIVAVGGGSVIDESKAIALGCRHGEPLWDFYLRKLQVREALPLVAVQTLPATSSELNQASVLTNEDTKEKYSARSIHIAPKVSFLDPEYTKSIPLSYTAYACTDILSHMMEGYFTTTASWIPVQDGMVEGVCRAVIEAMERLMSNPKDPDARAAVMWAGALAWSGLMNAGVDGAAIPNHMLEHPVSAHFDIAHGAGLSIIIPGWLKYRKNSIAHRIIRFGRFVLGMDSELDSLPADKQADRVIEGLENWYREIGTPVSFKEAGILNPDMESMADQAGVLCRHWGITGYSKEDIIKIYKLCI